MPIIEVVGIGNVELPDGMSKEQMAAALNKLPKPKPEQGNMYTQSAEDITYSPEGIPLNTSSYGSAPTGLTKDAQQVLTSTVSLPVNIATGIAKTPSAVMQAYDKLIGGGKTGDNMVNAINQIESGTQSQIGGFGNVVNKIGSAVGQAAPFMSLGTTGMIPSFAEKVAQSTGLGVLSGALTPEKTGLTPEQYKEAKLNEILLQGGIGVAIPLAGGAIKTGYNAAKSLVEPLYTSGREAIIGRALRQFAGNDAEQAIVNMKNAQPLVPGSQPTVAEVAGVPSLAALQRTANNVSPEAINALAQRQQANTVARTTALENIASPSRIGKYENLRANLGNELYTPALNASMDFASLTPNMQKEVGNLAKTPAIKRAMAEARENALNKGYDLGNPRGSLQGLHETKMALDQEINAVKAKLQRDSGGATSAELDGLNAAKDRLLGFIENVSPEYKKARETYARLSKPIEQLETISNISDKSLNPKDYSIYLSRFSGELEKAKKEGLLSPQQLNRLQTIKEDLMRTDFASTAGKPPGTNTIQNLAYANMLNQLNLPNLLRRNGLSETVSNIGARVGDVVYGKANKEIANQLAETMLDPKQAVAYMEAVKGLPKGTKMTEETANQIKRANLAKMLMMQQSTQGEK
jgi:hypothetical protein